MHIFSQMTISVKSGLRDVAIRAFIDRNVFEECAQAIPGFLSGELLAPDSNPDEIVIVARWSHKQAFVDWNLHEVRHLQEADLSHFLAAPPVISRFTTKHHFSRTSIEKGN